MRARLHATLAAFVLAAALFGITAQSASAVPTPFYGVQFSNYGQYNSATDMDFVQRSGSKYFRVNINWSQVVANGWGPLNNLFGLAAERGITILPNLYGNKTGGKTFPTKFEYTAWNAFVTEVIGRYGYGGSFWAGRSTVLPPPAWEVWNEPNLAENNPGGATAQPENYAAFLATTATTIRSLQTPQPKILLGGLYWGVTESGGNQPGAKFLEGVKKAEEKAGKSGAAFDGLGLHPYALAGENSLKVSKVKERVNQARTELNKFESGSSKGIWITELGWQTEFSEGTITEVTPAKQAELLTASFDWIAEVSTEKKIESLIWYNGIEDGPPGWAAHCGLRSASGVYRPSYQAFTEETGVAPFITPPSAFTDSAGNERVFVATPGGINQYVKTPGGKWNGEVVATGSFISRPSVFQDPSGNNHVFVNTAGGINHYVQSPAGIWSGEIVASFAGFKSTPTAFRDSTGDLHVYVTTGGGLNHYRLSGGKWSGEIVASFAGFLYDPAVFKDSGGNTHVFIATSAGINHYVQSPGGSWSGEISALGTFSSPPSAFIDGSGNLHLTAGTVGGLNYYRKAPGKAWTGELIATGAYTFTSPPASFGDASGNVHVVVATAGGVNRYIKPPNSAWSGEIVGTGSAGSFSSEPMSYALPGNGANVFVDTLGGINHYEYSPSTGWTGEIVATK